MTQHEITLIGFFEILVILVLAFYPTVLYLPRGAGGTDTLSSG